MDSTGSFPEGMTESDFSTSITSVATDNTPPDHTQEGVMELTQGESVSSSGPDMLVVIIGAVCGSIILFLLITLFMLILIILTRSRKRYIC